MQYTNMKLHTHICHHYPECLLKIVPNLLGKWINILTFLKTAEDKQASHQNNGAHYQWGLFQRGKITSILSLSSPL